MTTTIATMLITSLLVGLLGTLLRKYFINDNQLGIAGGFLFNAVSTFMAGVVLCLWGGIDTVSFYTVLWEMPLIAYTVQS